MRRWVFVGGVGVGCGLVLGWILWSLTGSEIAALVAGAGVASILVVLAVGGARQNASFHSSAGREADARARRARVQEAMRQTREP